MATKTKKPAKAAKPKYETVKGLFNFYGARLSKSEKYVNVSLRADDDKGVAHYANATVKADKCKFSKDGETVYVPVKFFEDVDEDVED